MIFCFHGYFFQSTYDLSGYVICNAYLWKHLQIAFFCDTLQKGAKLKLRRRNRLKGTSGFFWEDGEKS